MNMWQCDYCRSLNSGLEFYCCKCGAPKHIHSYEEGKGMNNIAFASGTSKNYGISIPYSEQKDLVLPSGTYFSFDVPLSEEEYKEFATFVANNYKFYSNDEMREIFWRHFGR